MIFQYIDLNLQLHSRPAITSIIIIICREKRPVKLGDGGLK